VVPPPLDRRRKCRFEPVSMAHSRRLLHGPRPAAGGRRGLSQRVATVHGYFRRWLTGWWRFSALGRAGFLCVGFVANRLLRPWPSHPAEATTYEFGATRWASGGAGPGPLTTSMPLSRCSVSRSTRCFLFPWARSSALPGLYGGSSLGEIGSSSSASSPWVCSYACLAQGRADVGLIPVPAADPGPAPCVGVGSRASRPRRSVCAQLGRRYSPLGLQLPGWPACAIEFIATSIAP